MRVRFWGTRGSIATPGPATNHFGGNTSCVELTTANGDLLIFDCGTGAHPLAAKLMAQGKKNINASILLGHTHWDHIQGFPFFSPAFVKGNSVSIYGPEGSRGSLHDMLAGQMEYSYFPIALDQLPAAITYHDLTEGIYTVGGARVATQFLNHPAMTVGYRVEADGVAMVYLVDHEPFSDELWRAGAEPGRIESILHEGDRRREIHGWCRSRFTMPNTPDGTPQKLGDTAYDYVVQIAAAAGVRQVVRPTRRATTTTLSRKSSASPRLALQRGTGLNVFCANEGCGLVLEAHSTLRPFVTTAPFQASVAERRFYILAVDDQPDTLAMIVRALEQEQYAVSQATSGPEALRMIDVRLPDLVVLDYKMAGMDGLAVVRALRAKPETQTLPVLMLTAMTDESSTRAGFEAGVKDYVTKPFSIPQLTSRVRACLARAQPQ
jgi:CheY-like chemotaxis protein